MVEEEHRMAAYHLNKARGNVIERKDYRRALEHAEKAIAFLKKLNSLKEKEGVDILDKKVNRGCARARERRT